MIDVLPLFRKIIILICKLEILGYNKVLLDCINSTLDKNIFENYKGTLLFFNSIVDFYSFGKLLNNK